MKADGTSQSSRPSW